MPTRKKHPRLSAISVLHYVRLVYRSALFLAALVIYLVNHFQHSGQPFGGWEHMPVILMIIWVVFAYEMVCRFFPSKYESMGCQKQFPVNYEPQDEPRPIPETRKSTAAVFWAWIGLNGLIALAYFLGLFDAGVLVLIALFYSVCDMICILFFCPFQTWFMKNKCCANCRIYNWDYAMMFTPFLLVPHWFTWSLLALALGLLASWELRFRRHPERFFEATNKKLACANCPEHLCHHKKQLHQFWKKNKDIFQLPKAGLSKASDLLHSLKDKKED